jgi:succinate dehydrogenase / fumarate reductase cytochrome b subunit
MLLFLQGRSRRKRKRYDDQKKTRWPVFLNLVQTQMPVGALTSITHRVTGILLALGIPFSIYFLDQSLRGPQSSTWLIGLFDKALSEG